MIDSEIYEQLLQELRSFLPSERIYTDELRTLAWGTDASFYRMTPRIVIRSDNEKEIEQIIKACYNRHIPFTFRAAGTSLSGQSLSDSVLIVAGKSWEKYQVSADQPGLLGGRVNSILRPFGRVLPPDPASVNSAMIGGIVCNNASGMNCGVHANSDRMLCSARIILADGTPLDMNKSYKVVVNDFMFPGGDKYDFSKATNVVETYIPIRDALIDEIKAAKTITPKAPDYIKDISK